jgi:hypothetical protein
MAGGASAATTGQATDTQQNISPRHEVFLGEQEVSDVSLSTFYVFDKENTKPQAGEKVAWWGGCRCGGCRCGCGWRRCGGCGGCGGCCLSWGRCGAC